MDVLNCNTNSKIWPNNGKLRLENWLTNDNKFKNNKNMLTFSIGKRDCTGKAVAMRIIYLTVGNILLNYKIETWNKNNTNIIKQNNELVRQLDPQIGFKVNKRR